MESSRPSRSRAPHRKGKSLNKRSKPAYGVFVEFCCSPQSSLGKVSESVGVKHVRQTKANGDIARFDVQEQLLEVLDSDDLNGVDLGALCLAILGPVGRG